MTELFLNAIQNKSKIKLTFFSKEDNQQITRLTAPMDFGPSRRANNSENRYHFWDYESNTANHTLSLLPNQIVTMEFTNIPFEPSEFITWTTNWIINRDWGMYS